MRLSRTSVKNIPVWIPNNPVGIDAMIAKIRLKLIELTWLDRAYGRAFELRTMIDNSPYIFPAVMTGEGQDLMDVLALDNNTSYSFMITAGPDEPLVEDGNYQDIDVYERALDLIFWIDNNSTSETIEKRKNEIRAKLKEIRFDGLGSIAVEAIFDEPEEVFEGFSYEPIDTQALYPPYWGLRFRLNVGYYNPCTDFDFSAEDGLLRYFGLVDSPTFDDADILALSSDVEQGLSVTFGVTPVGSQYPIFGYPASRDDLTSIKVGGFESIQAFDKITQDFNNGETTESYKFYVAKNAFNIQAVIETS